MTLSGSGGATLADKTVLRTALTVERAASEGCFWLGFEAELEGEPSETVPRATRLGLGISGGRRDCDKGYFVGGQDWRRRNFTDCIEPFEWEGSGDERFLNSFISIHRHETGGILLEDDDDGWAASLNDARWCNCLFGAVAWTG